MQHSSLHAFLHTEPQMNFILVIRQFYRILQVLVRLVFPCETILHLSKQVSDSLLPPTFYVSNAAIISLLIFF